MQTLRDWRPGDNIFEALHHEEPVLAIRELQGEASGIGARLQELTGQLWRPSLRQIAKIVNEGPADEAANVRADYVDCRYWALLQVVEGTEFRGNPIFSEDTTNKAHQSPGDIIAPNLLTVVNLAEWDADTHTLPVDGTEYVVIEGWWDTGLTPDGEGDGTAEDAQFTLHWFFERTTSHFTARIGTHSQDGSNKRWTYTCAEVEKSAAGYGGWTTKTGGRTGTAYNRFENMNGATGLYGNGVASTSLTGSFDIQPIPEGLIVEMKKVQVLGGAAEFWFSAMNGIDGAC